MFRKTKLRAVAAFALPALCAALCVAMVSGCYNYFNENIGFDSLRVKAGEGKTITVPGANLDAKLSWLSGYGGKNVNFIVEVTADETINNRVFGSYSYHGNNRPLDITITLKGIDINRTVSLSNISIDDGVTLVLESNITLKKIGVKDPLISNSGYNRSGTLRMNEGSAITGGSVNVGTFVMNGGKISGNISNNSTVSAGNFTMNGGEISGNTVSSTTGNATGGGVYVHRTFTMNGGTISGNTANYGGGVYAAYDTFTMRGGTISGNTARSSGGGVYVSYNSSFAKTGGTITGYNSDQANGNVVRDADDFTLGRMGHAVYARGGGDTYIRKETTSGTGDNLTYGGSRGTTGAWDR